jgi:hypothetical protein
MRSFTLGLQQPNSNNTTPSNDHADAPPRALWGDAAVRRLLPCAGSASHTQSRARGSAARQRQSSRGRQRQRTPQQPTLGRLKAYCWRAYPALLCREQQPTDGACRDQPVQQRAACAGSSRACVHAACNNCGAYAVAFSTRYLFNVDCCDTHVRQGRNRCGCLPVACPLRALVFAGCMSIESLALQPSLAQSQAAHSQNLNVQAFTYTCACCSNTHLRISFTQVCELLARERRSGARAALCLRRSSVFDFRSE